MKSDRVLDKFKNQIVTVYFYQSMSYWNEIILILIYYNFKYIYKSYILNNNM